MIEKIALGLLSLAVGVVPTMVLLTTPVLAQSGVEEKGTQESLILAQAGTWADVTLRLEDLPPGFTAMPPSDVLDFLDPGSLQEIDVENVFGFANDQDFQLIMGVTTRLETAQQQAEFDELVGGPEKLKSWSLLGQTNEPPQALNNITNIGDVAEGVSLKLDLGGTVARVEILGLRKNQMGAVVFVVYGNDERPLYPIAEIGRKLVERIPQVPTGSN
ncbi:hypothetical protein NG799_21200 [Laspinema sp. D1]|uniref:Uncharacterized protein n=1 Tax=Laspinema palackyanum D2a TaxID=2953684 RepID=A0ABT2MVR3_9CYAN|nr:hypothetical protein [Laspinema sp. D2b]MCT7968831.1 hypothetical protein [Laspinema sp. D2a]